MSCSVELSMKSFIASKPRLGPKDLWILSAMALSVHVAYVWYAYGGICLKYLDRTEHTV